ncbi:MAG: FAD-dependent oxidoreductase [Desulfuromonadaceae bacterium]
MSEPSQRWQCTVCGYVHEGSSPCEYCPICGATSDLFEVEAEATAPVAAAVVGKWRCLNCEYVHEGQTPPNFCPVCAATAEHFEPLGDATPSFPTSSQALTFVVVGAGIAGVSAAEAIRNHAPKAKITLLSRESELPYYRLNLTRYLAAEIDGDALPIHEAGWYRENDIELLRDTELRSIDVKRKRLQLRKGQDLDYDKLILAMGSHPFVPPFPGVNRENVTVLRTRRDAEFILGQLRPGLSCVVIGGGVLGLETAGALARRKVDVTLVEGYGWLMPQQLNQAAAERLAAQATELGIKFCMGARVKQLDGDERVRGVALESGVNLPAELVIITAGVRANSYVARLAGIGTNNGIVVDNRLLTDTPDIYAVGDVAEHRGILYGTWGPSQFQGTIAGMNAAGETTEFAGIPRSNSLKVLGCELFSIGQVRPGDGSYQEVEEIDGEDYYFFLFRDSQLVGAILLGDTRLSAAVKRLVEKKLPCIDLLGRHAAGQRIHPLLNDFGG